MFLRPSYAGSLGQPSQAALHEGIEAGRRRPLAHGSQLTKLVGPDDRIDHARERNDSGTPTVRSPIMKTTFSDEESNVERYDLALIGFGGVNRALSELICERGVDLSARMGFELRVVAITDLRMGSLISADGIDLRAVLAMPSGDTFAGQAGGHAEPRNEEVIRSSSADIIVEATFTNPVDGEPAVSHVKWALESGKHVTTTNKGPVALAGEGLKRLAAQNEVQFEFEGSVMSGTPVIRLGRQLSRGLDVSGFEGILNGTSNYVIGRMEEGMTLANAVVEAQTHGYAEADPSADIEGSDVQLKVVILANELLGANLTTQDVSRVGISELTADDIVRAATEGKRWKLIGSATRASDGSVTAKVRPLAVPDGHPLYGVNGPTNALTYWTDLLGDVTIVGAGAGRVETAYALLSDILAIHDSAQVRSIEASNA